MGWLSKAFKKVKNVVKKSVGYATGGLIGFNKSKQDAKRAYAEQQAQAVREKELAQQDANRNRQESSNLAALQQDPTADAGGVLTSVDGLVPGDRKLSKKKLLGG